MTEQERLAARSEALFRRQTQMADARWRMNKTKEQAWSDFYAKSLKIAAEYDTALEAIDLQFAAPRGGAA